MSGLDISEIRALKMASYTVATATIRAVKGRKILSTRAALILVSTDYKLDIIFLNFFSKTAVYYLMYAPEFEYRMKIMNLGKVYFNIKNEFFLNNYYNHLLQQILQHILVHVFCAVILFHNISQHVCVCLHQ